MLLPLGEKPGVNVISTPLSAGTLFLALCTVICGTESGFCTCPNEPPTMRVSLPKAW